MHVRVKLTTSLWQDAWHLVLYTFPIASLYGVGFRTTCPQCHCGRILTMYVPQGCSQLSASSADVRNEIVCHVRFTMQCMRTSGTSETSTAKLQ